jgi:uncharacterized protein (TIGR03437 family)
MIRQQLRSTAAVAVLPYLMALGFSDTARGQATTISVDQSILNFALPANGVSTQQLAISTNNSTTVFVNLTNLPSWLSISPAAPNSFPNLNVSSTQPTLLNVTATTTGIAAGMYQYMFTLSIQGTGTTPLTITVNLNVTPASTILSATPTSLSFTAQQGAQVGNPQGIPVQIVSSAQVLSYTLSVSTTDGHQWINLLPSCTNLNPCGTDAGGFTVSVNPAAQGLTARPAPYTGTIIAQSTTTADSVAIPVSLTVSANPVLTVSPASLPKFLYQLGSQGVQPSQQTLAVTSTGGAVQFSVSMNPPVGWLVLNQTSGSTGLQPVLLTLSINGSGLPTAAGTYATAISVIPGSGIAPSPINVTLVVSSHALLKLGNSSVTLTAPFASQTILTQQVTLTSTGDPVAFAVLPDQNAPWLTVTPPNGSASSTVPATLTVQVDPSHPNVLPSGDYTGTITVVPQNADPYSLTITVSLNITIGSQFTSGPPAVHFSYQTTQLPPAAQIIQLGSTGPPIQFTIGIVPNPVTASCPANWLIATTQSTTTPAFVTIGVQTAGMLPGTCTNNVVILPPIGSDTTPLNIPVTVDISDSPELNVSFQLGFGVQTVKEGASQSTFGVSLSSSDPLNQVNFTASSNVPWLAVAPTSLSTTPQTLSVIVSPSSPVPLTASATPYAATITITSQSLPSSFIQIPYSLTVNPNITVAVTPTGPLSFTQPQGGPIPQAQTLTLTTTGGSSNFTASITPVTGGNWLTVSSASGTVNSSGTLIVSVNPSVSNLLSANPNPYTSKITLAFPGSASPPLTITVSLTVTQAQTFSVQPASVTFTYQSGGPAPASKPLDIAITGGPIPFTVGTTSSGGWLSVDTTSGNTSATINVSADPLKIPAGTQPGAPLTGTIAVNAPSVLTNPILVNVTFTLLTAPTPLPSTITNSGSGGFGSIAPGELIAIKGTLLGPPTPAAGTTFTLNPQGGVDATLAGVQVFFDGIAGIPTYVSPTQINVIVPYEIAGRTSTNITVRYQGVQSAAIPQVVAPIAPSVYTLNATGQGQAAAVNLTGSTAGTINGPPSGVAVQGGVITTSPADGGTFLAVFGTGGGQTNPLSVTGSVSPSNTLLPLAGWSEGSNTVTATVGGQPATVTFAGAAPTLVTGVIQINLKLPAGITGNSLPIVITINGVPTQTGATVAVQ